MACGSPERISCGRDGNDNERGGGFRNSDFDVIGILISHFSLVFDFFSAALESYGRLIFARAFTR